jgi:chromosome segregation ATPase
MKFITILLSVLLFLAVAATAQEDVEVNASGEQVPAGCDCSGKIAGALQPLMNEKNGLIEQLNGLREELNACANDKQGLYQEVEQSRKSLDQTRKDADYWMKAAGEHEGTAQEKHGMVEEKIRHLGEMESKMKALEAELFAAKEEIKNLSEISFVSQLKKELETLWTSIILFWQNLMAKKEN